MFGNVFGNTIYSASLVVAVFMLGLGVGSYRRRPWADRRYAVRAGIAAPRLSRWFELGIAAIGLAIAAAAAPPGRGVGAAVVVRRATRTAGTSCRPTSHAARAGMAIVLLTPITLLMGGTLTLLIRYLVRTDLMQPDAGTSRVLYGVNTAGAAAGAFSRTSRSCRRSASEARSWSPSASISLPREARCISLDGLTSG